jgi:hypothetical protein
MTTPFLQAALAAEPNCRTRSGSIFATVAREWHSRVTDRPVKLSRLPFVRTTYLFAVLIAMAGWTWLLFRMVASGIDFFD